MRNLISLVSLFGMTSVAKADITMCQQAYSKNVRQCYDLVMSARTAATDSNTAYSNAVQKSSNIGTRELGQTMQNSGLSGLEIWNSTKDKCEKLKDDCDTKCKIPDTGASFIAKKCREGIERYATIIDSGIEASTTAYNAGSSTASSVYDQATSEQAEARQARGTASDQVIGRTSDLSEEGQGMVQKATDYTVVGRDATGRPITEEPYVLKQNLENIKKQIKQCNPSVSEVCVYTNKYD